MKMLSVRLDDAEFATLARLSEQLGETRTEVVRHGIAELAQRKLRTESPHELAEKMGLIGSFSGRADLSQNVALHVRRKLRAAASRNR